MTQCNEISAYIKFKSFDGAKGFYFNGHIVGMMDGAVGALKPQLSCLSLRLYHGS